MTYPPVRYLPHVNQPWWFCLNRCWLGNVSHTEPAHRNKEAVMVLFWLSSSVSLWFCDADTISLRSLRSDHVFITAPPVTAQSPPSLMSVLTLCCHLVSVCGCYSWLSSQLAVTPTCCNNKPRVGVLVGGCYTFSLIMVLFLYISWFWSFLKEFNKLFPALLHLKQTEAGQPCLLWPHLVSWRLQNEEADV